MSKFYSAQLVERARFYRWDSVIRNSLGEYLEAAQFTLDYNQDRETREAWCKLAERRGDVLFKLLKELVRRIGDSQSYRILTG